MKLNQIVDNLARHYGEPKAEPPKGPFQMILWENVAYLLNDDRRAEAFRALKEGAGLTPKAILGASAKDLLAIAKLGGMRPEERREKLRSIARLAQNEFGDALGASERAFLALPAPQIKRSLRKFPGIGEPGADKILLFCGVEAVPTVESNGLRVLDRVGVAREQKNYSASYRAAQSALREAAPGPDSEASEDADFYIRAFRLLRRHGQELCLRSAPSCGGCPLAKECPSVVE